MKVLFNHVKTLQQLQGLLLVIVVCICFISIQYLWLRFPPANYCLDVQSLAAEELKEKTAKPQVLVSPSNTIYVITPTYRRLHQIAELTRLAQTLMHIPDMVWLVIEDDTTTSPAVEELLNRTGMQFVHLVAPMPDKYKFDQKLISASILPRGVSNRNRGLEWIRANATSGVLFFADDDNTYDIRLFEEMRDTRRVSMWPVGLLSAGFSSPVVQHGKVIGFYEGWTGNRRFPVDMAQFAVSVEFLLQRPKALMPFKAGYEEDGFLMSLAPFDVSEIELKASNCTEILVWHTQTKSPRPLKPIDTKIYEGTNIIQLYTSQH